MTDIERARDLFHSAGLTLPSMPDPLAERLVQKDRWVFATRDLPWSPYSLRSYVQEAEGSPEDYVVLAHSGHGVNSYALQYYLVVGGLRLFLHLGFGGGYMDGAKQTAQANTYFALADEIVELSAHLNAATPLTVVASDFYGSRWSMPDGTTSGSERLSPAEALETVLEGLRNHN